jgi:hypothetical protein
LTIDNDEGKKGSRKGAKAQEKNKNAKGFSPLVKS